MAGLEGYFGPNRIQLNDSYVDDWEPRYQDIYGRPRAPRPTDINLPSTTSSITTKTVTIQEDEEAVRKYVAVGVSLATLITENLLSHPFVVLRRQCQVHPKSKKYHLVPFSLIPVIVHLHQQQGITTLWKGLGSVLLIRGMTLAVEDLISKVTPWPKEVNWHAHSLKATGQHLLLKCVTLAIITPFYSASLVETVQSDIASEKPGIFDVFKEGICRLVSWGSPQKGRMLPVWTLVLPTVVYGLLKYMFSSAVRNVASKVLHLQCKKELEKKGAFPKDWLSQASAQDIEVSAQLISLIASETVFYPLETILHRLHLQGTRTIIDNLDNGFSVTPILTNYEGALDCYDSTLSQEGSQGLFKGLGALVLQFTAHFAVIKLVKYLLTQTSTLLKAPIIPHPDHPTQPSRVMSMDPVRTPVR